MAMAMEPAVAGRRGRAEADAWNDARGGGAGGGVDGRKEAAGGRRHRLDDAPRFMRSRVRHGCGRMAEAEDWTGRRGGMYCTVVGPGPDRVVGACVSVSRGDDGFRCPKGYGGWPPYLQPAGHSLAATAGLAAVGIGGRVH
jgi:hypothetical protein